MKALSTAGMEHVFHYPTRRSVQETVVGTAFIQWAAGKRRRLDDDRARDTVASSLANPRGCEQDGTSLQHPSRLTHMLPPDMMAEFYALS
jgi:hypothetical protein